MIFITNNNLLHRQMLKSFRSFFYMMATSRKSFRPLKDLENLTKVIAERSLRDYNFTDRDIVQVRLDLQKYPKKQKKHFFKAKQQKKAKKHVFCGGHSSIVFVIAIVSIIFQQPLEAYPLQLAYNLVELYATLVDELKDSASPDSCSSGRPLTERMANRTFKLSVDDVFIDSQGVRNIDLTILGFNTSLMTLQVTACSN